VITSENARGDSPAVNLAEYRKHASLGAVALRKLVSRSDVRCYARDVAWRRTRDSWGGITLTLPKQAEVRLTAGYAVSVSRGDTVSIPADADEGKFRDAYDSAVRRFAYAPYLGIFRDDDTGQIEFDAVVITTSENEARDIATHCESLGGAYDFATGNGVFPYHVTDTGREQCQLCGAHPAALVDHKCR
jgi:hypothetical protein